MKHKKLFWIIGIIVGVLIILFVAGLILANRAANEMAQSDNLFGFADKGYDSYSYDEDYYGDEPSYAAMEAPSAGYMMKEDVMEEAAPRESAPIISGQGQKTEQKVVKSAYMELVVGKVSQTVESVTQLVTQKQGFISDSNIYTRDDKTQYGTITIRVPVNDFEQVLTQLKALAKSVEEESVSGVDVTEEFVDMESRLENLRLEEEQYQKVLQKATDIQDILDVNDYLFDVREDIELIEGRMKYLTDLTDMSTIQVNLSEEPTLSIPTGEWKPVTTIKLAFTSAIRFFQGLVDLLIWLAFYVIPLAIIVYIIVKIVKAVKRRRRKSKK
ncbi:DUF4349 domain-containing protein [Patescibacteria group bacterium]|nr:DUF4349 domain-containing protein [Patescibacteria group bacterium]MBU1922549.1 DUF4349 domain-containing protein [Patescibacteria group bacterium]